MKTPGIISRLHSGSSALRCMIYALILSFCSALRCMIYALILSFCLPAPLAFAPVTARADNADATHVLRRLNGPERAAAVAKMNEASARGEGKGVTPSPSPLALSPTSPHSEGQGAVRPEQHEGEQDSTQFPLRGGTDGPRSSAASAPRSLSSILMEQAASFLGVPAPITQKGPVPFPYRRKKSFLA